MSTDINLLKNGIVRLAILLLLFFATPIIITMGFKGIQKLTDTLMIFVSYFLVILGFSGILFTIYFAFKTFSILKKAMFNEH